jgi:hypothetical protein
MMTILPKPVSRRKKITRKKHYWKNCQVSENNKNDIRTTPNKPYRTKRELSTPKSRSTQVEHTKDIVFSEFPFSSKKRKFSNKINIL